MDELKTPKKQLLFYYGIALALLILFNLLLLPRFIEAQVKEVDYGTFMSMTEEGNIGHVEIQTNKIVFTNKEENMV